MPKPLALAAPLAALLLSGCMVAEVASLPVKAAKAGVGAVSSGVDVLTTSQAEADQKRGKAIRQREERLGKLERRYGKLADSCEDGSDKACREAEAVRTEIDALLPGVPYERRD